MVALWPQFVATASRADWEGNSMEGKCKFRLHFNTPDQTEELCGRVSVKKHANNVTLGF